MERLTERALGRFDDLERDDLVRFLAAIRQNLVASAPEAVPERDVRPRFNWVTAG
ncbi:MAG: hypothetical protein M3024_07870 [Candidatus Dormibacteraeota bacterium]|nr:hypothetical protein [Candidatus Dormibacteraeota bacterium]